jgi:hypothetical protein
MTALLAYTAFAIGVASPGPSVLAVMGTAMAQGRTRALVLASGVVCRAGRRVRVCGRAHAAVRPNALNQIRTRLSR